MTNHFLSERIDAGEFALCNNDVLKLIDLAVEEFPLNVYTLLKRLHGAPNL